MNIPDPQFSTAAIGLPLGHLSRSQLDTVVAAGKTPVFLHRLGGEKERQRTGPREMRAHCAAVLEGLEWKDEPILGAVCVEMDDAAHFATAGFQWFTLDLGGKLNLHAREMSLAELDQAIVSLEDAGCYPAGWHEGYLDKTFEIAPDFSIQIDDEALARAAVTFGPALQHAEQLQQTIRMCWLGQGKLPEVEVSFAGAALDMTAAQLLFVCAELRRRGISAGVIAPAAGNEAGEPAERPSTDAAIAAHFGIARTRPGSHEDHTEESTFAAMRVLAERDASLFREWLVAARDAFSVARIGWHISTSEDDARFLPEVGDGELADIFLGNTQGRQLILCTWDMIPEDIRERAKKTLAAE